VIEFLAEVIGWAFDAVMRPAEPEPRPEADPGAAASPRPTWGDRLVRGLTLLLAAVFVLSIVGAPVLWFTGTVDGMTAIGLTIAGLIAGQIGYLLARHRRTTSDL
jgi:hypothetical protein